MRNGDRMRMLAVLRQFRVIVAALREHYGALERASGLGGAQLWALAEVANARELSVGDLARRMGIKSPTASNLVRALLERQLVRKLRTREDQRIVCVSVTPEGKALLRRAPQPIEGLLQSALARMPAARLDSLHAHLDDVLALLHHERDAADRLLPEIVRPARRRGE